MAAKPRNRVSRMPSRAAYDRETVEAILDEAIVSHIGTIEDPAFPIVIPTLHARAGDWLYIHGSAASKTLRRAGQAEICLTATLIDGLVLARSAVHHSINYRSVVVFGQAEAVESAEDKATALKAFTEKLIPGRWDDVRAPSALELRATGVLRLPLDEASAKVRTGGPLDDEPDYDLPVWAGTVGLRLAANTPEADDRIISGVQCPDYVTNLVRARA